MENSKKGSNDSSFKARRSRNSGYSSAKRFSPYSMGQPMSAAIPTQGFAQPMPVWHQPLMWGAPTQQFSAPQYSGPHFPTQQFQTSPGTSMPFSQTIASSSPAANSQLTTSSVGKEPFRCFACGQEGHASKNCPAKLSK